MNALIGVGSAVGLVIAATGLYNLQWWLERSDYQRHFED
jgi:hypothetical protein